MICYMKRLLNPVQEDLALERVINVPPRRVGATSILRLKNASTTSQDTIVGRPPSKLRTVMPT